jgi:hypothetical protein
VSSAVPLGTPDHASGGETGVEAVQVYLTGIVAPSAKAGLVTVIETLGPPGATVAVGVPVGELVVAAGVLLTDDPPQAVAATAPRSSATRAFLRAPSSIKRFGRIVSSRDAHPAGPAGACRKIEFLFHRA